VFAGLIGAIVAWITLVCFRVFVLDGSLKSLANLLTPVPWFRIWETLPLLALTAAVINAVTGWITLRFYVRV